MPIITSQNRTQIEFKSLVDFIEKDNTVIFIDAFVEKLEIDKLEFITKLVVSILLQKHHKDMSIIQQNK
jgi:hypothetical protein